MRLRRAFSCNSEPEIFLSGSALSELSPNFVAYKPATVPITSKQLDRTRPVAYLQGEGNYTYLHYPDGTAVLTSSTLKKVSSWYPDMIQVRKGVAVNPNYVISFNRYSVNGLRVYLEFAGKTVTLEASRRLVVSVEEAIRTLELTSYLQNR